MRLRKMANAADETPEVAAEVAEAAADEKTEA